MTYLTSNQAIALGYTINNHAPGRPIAYKGKTFAPTSIAPILTELEEKLLCQLEQAYSMLQDINNGWPMHELCISIPEWKKETDRIMNEVGA